MITLHVANIRCGGCSTTISRTLCALAGVRQVFVAIEAQTVTLDADPDIVPHAITALQSLGYPQADAAKDANGIGTQFKSVVSCALGKLGGRRDARRDPAP